MQVVQFPKRVCLLLKRIYRTNHLFISKKHSHQAAPHHPSIQAVFLFIMEIIIPAHSSLKNVIYNP
jgi:hypothetical protein